MSKETPSRSKIKDIIAQHGLHDFRWITPEQIVVSQWVCMKCLYGCHFYGLSTMCPPHVPSVAKCQKFFSEMVEISCRLDALPTVEVPLLLHFFVLDDGD